MNTRVFMICGLLLAMEPEAVRPRSAFTMRNIAREKLQVEEAVLREEQAAAALDAATSPAVSPFLAARDDLHRGRGCGREHLFRLLDQAEGNVKLQGGLAKRADAVQRHEARIVRLKEELAQLGNATDDRDRIISQVSNRYGELLRAWHYPKVGQPYIRTGRL
ncbi:hypothetical protein [Streptomyces sp. NPDC053560]|uniref:hypothetical protein n=1 Tax=Streptomyces sp. NPDC053560 TaxID=3365711 RepID=UPI0037D7A8D4